MAFVYRDVTRNVVAGVITPSELDGVRGVKQRRSG